MAAAVTFVCVGVLLGAGSADAATHRQLRAQIIGGQPVPAGMFPQLAYIVDEVSPGNYQSCTGTVLSSDVVLTAGHCAENQETQTADPAAGFNVVTGQPNLAGPPVGQVSAVSKVIVYPAYDPTTRDWDAALLELSTPTTAPPITLASSADAALWQPATEVAIAGWGLTDGADPTSQPTQVQWATTVTQSPDYCEANALSLQSTFDSTSQLCAIDTPTDATGACHGDSGGPLLAQYGTATPVEIGITIWGEAGCDSTYPTFFTETAAISDWAETWVQDLPPPPAATPTPTPTPAPAPTPTPVATASRQAPRAGRYYGHSSQRRVVELTVASSATTVSAVTFGFRSRCSRGRHPSSTLRTRRFAIRNLAFGRERRTSGGDTYALVGRFNTTGTASGTLRASWHSARYGRCHSGVIRWNAKS
jgi:secreted trypsin-like serine protease